MKRLISALDCHQHNKPAPLFYKCRMFCIYNDELDRIEYYENPYYDQPEGYEIKLVDWIVKKGISEVYSVRYNEKVVQGLEERNIAFFVLENKQHSVADIIESFKHEA